MNEALYLVLNPYQSFTYLLNFEVRLISLIVTKYNVKYFRLTNNLVMEPFVGQNQDIPLQFVLGSYKLYMLCTLESEINEYIICQLMALGDAGE